MGTIYDRSHEHLGTTDAMMNPSELTTQAPTTSGDVVLRPRMTSVTLSLFVLMDAPRAQAGLGTIGKDPLA